MIGCVEKNTRRRMSFSACRALPGSVGGTPYCNGDNTSTFEPGAAQGGHEVSHRERRIPREVVQVDEQGSSAGGRHARSSRAVYHVAPRRWTRWSFIRLARSKVKPRWPRLHICRVATNAPYGACWTTCNKAIAFASVPAPCKRARADPASAAVRQASAAVQEAQRLIGTAGAARPSNAPE